MSSQVFRYADGKLANSLAMAYALGGYLLGFGLLFVRNRWLDAVRNPFLGHAPGGAALGDWEQAPGARLCHPPGAEEHLLPLMVVAGAAGADPGAQVFSDRVMETRLSAFTFG